jgi:hypothetical protein
MLHSKYTTPPARLEEMKEELKNYEHYGGGDDEGPSRHLNFWNQKQKSFPELKPPPKTSSCYCGEFIIRNNYLYSDRVLLSQMVRKRSSVSNVQDSAQRDKIRPVHSVSNKQINTATLFQCGLHDSVAYTARCRGRDAHLEHVTVGHWHQESEELSRILLTAHGGRRRREGAGARQADELQPVRRVPPGAERQGGAATRQGGRSWPSAPAPRAPLRPGRRPPPLRVWRGLHRDSTCLAGASWVGAAVGTP